MEKSGQNNSRKKAPKRAALFCAFCAFSWLMLFAGLIRAKDPALLETGRAEKIADAKAEKLKIVSYNMRWRGGQDLEKIIRLLREDKEIGGAAIVCLQEVDRNKKRTKNVNTVRQMADALGFYYVWAAPPTTEKDAEEETGVAILSRFPLSDAKHIVLPVPGPKGRRRVAVSATADAGGQKIRVYSLHAEVRIESDERLQQLRAVIDDAKNYPVAIVAGDFNTYSRVSQADAANLFLDAGFSTPLPHDEATWRTFIVELKLDWLWLRGLKADQHGIGRKVKMSDHWPLWVEVSSKFKV
jgi:endonuclease/exonuclease/phosphatase family metal-dependent hydrolase